VSVPTDDATRQRHAALTDCLDMTRRAAAAALAAANGDPNVLRADFLHEIHRGLLTLLSQLQALI
jgi:hypothetical protein